MEKSIRPVLVVEQDPEQGLLVQIGFQEAWVRNPVIVLMNGETAIAYLSGEPPYEDRRRHPLPALLLLDLEPTRSAGLQVLEWLANRPTLRAIPVVALVSPDATELHERAYRLGAGICIVKPTNFRELVPRIQTWARFWLGAETQAHGETEIA